MRVLVTGSRDGMSAAAASWLKERLRGLVAEHDEVTLIEGGAGGVDAQASEIAEALEIRQERHMALWGTYGKAAGPIRNQEMLDSGVDLVLAFPGPQSRGTRDMVRRSKSANIPVQVFEL